MEGCGDGRRAFARPREIVKRHGLSSGEDGASGAGCKSLGKRWLPVSLMVEPPRYLTRSVNVILVKIERGIGPRQSLSVLLWRAIILWPLFLSGMLLFFWRSAPPPLILSLRNALCHPTGHHRPVRAPTTALPASIVDPFGDRDQARSLLSSFLRSPSAVFPLWLRRLPPKQFGRTRSCLSPPGLFALKIPGAPSELFPIVNKSY